MSHIFPYIFEFFSSITKFSFLGMVDLLGCFCTRLSRLHVTRVHSKTLKPSTFFRQNGRARYRRVKFMQKKNTEQNIAKYSLYQLSNFISFFHKSALQKKICQEPFFGGNTHQNDSFEYGSIVCKLPKNASTSLKKPRNRHF